MQIRQSLDAYGATGAEYQRPHFLTLLAETVGLLGQPEGGWPPWKKPDPGGADGEQYYAAELHRQRGELLLLRAAQRRPAQGQSGSTRRRDVLSRPSTSPPLEAKALELRAAMSLSRLWQRQGKRAEPTRCCANLRLVQRGATQWTSKTPGRCWKRWRANTDGQANWSDVGETVCILTLR